MGSHTGLRSADAGANHPVILLYLLYIILVIWWWVHLVGPRMITFTIFEMMMTTLSCLGLLYGAPTTIFVVFKSSKAVPGL